MGMRKFAAIGIAMLLAAAVALGARKPAQKVWAGPPVAASFQVIYPGQQQLVVNLRDLPKGMDWAVGVRAEPRVVPAGQGFLMVEWLPFEKLPTASTQALPPGTILREPPPSENFPKLNGWVRVAPGSVTVWGRKSLSGRKLVIYAVLPYPLPVRIRRNGVTVATTAFNKGFMVRNGQVLAQVPDSSCSVIQTLIPNLRCIGTLIPEPLGPGVR